MTDKQFEKLREGDKVRIRTDLEQSRFYGPAFVTFPMMRTMGMTLMVKKIYKSYGIFTVIGSDWNYTPEMVSRVFDFKFGK